MGSCRPFSEARGDGGEGDKGMDQCLGSGRGRTRELIVFSHHAISCSNSFNALLCQGKRRPSST